MSRDDRQLTAEKIIKDPDQRKFIAQVTWFGLLLFVFVPLMTGLGLPFFLGLTDSPGEGILVRASHLLFSGGGSLAVAMIPVFAFTKVRFLQQLWVSLWFPVLVVCLAIQIIMYREFGTEVDGRILGLFQGNISALWIHACEVYRMPWVLTGYGFLCIAVAIWIVRPHRKVWKISFWPSLIVIGLMAVSGAFSIAMGYSSSKANHYHPDKVATVPVMQVSGFVAKWLRQDQGEDYERILKLAGEMKEASAHSEITRRLGQSPESYVRRTAETPEWLKKKPSHVFCFVLESIQSELLEDPALRAASPYLNRFQDEGVSVPYFCASDRSTISAVHSSMAGVGPQSRYPVPRALEEFELDTLPRMMKRAGYHPVFYAASHRKFGHKGDSCEAYGYEDFVGIPDVAEELESNGWGVNDGDFFEWCRERLTDLERGHFVTFLNVSNHVPFDAPVDELKPDYLLSEEAIARFTGRSDESRTQSAEHVLYSDVKMGQMAEWLRERYPDALFVFFGDHCGPVDGTADPDKVPFVLWNDNVIDPDVDTSRWFGTHMDIVATLANVVLPEGQEYRTLGEPVWSLADDRVSRSRESILTKQGKFDRQLGQLAGFDGAGEVYSHSLEDSFLKASALDALSWGYLQGKYLGSGKLAAD